MEKLPSFTIVDYKDLLTNIISKDFSFEPVLALDSGKNNSVYLRHDVDFSVIHAIPMAEAESQLGVFSTYYILLTGPYNIFHEKTSKAVRRLGELGHEIGLHYDLSTYPAKKEQASKRLRKEIDILEFVTGKQIKTIVMHEPFRGNQDIFLKQSGLINPSFYQKNDSGIRYISDSCRAWRDNNLIAFLARETAENRLHINIHPELWLSEKKQHRLTYLDQTLMPVILEENIRYFSETVKQVWLTHPAAVTGYGDEDED